MKIVRYIKKNGIKRAIIVLWKYKIEIVIEKIVNTFTKHKALKNTIVIESHNDFDCNGGAFYNYLLKNNYNKKYRIIWLVRKKVKVKLPYNVKSVPLFGPSIRKAYYMCTAKYFTYDCEGGRKLRNDQIVVYCSHGAGGLKNIQGKLDIPDSVNYILMQSPTYAPIQAKQWGIDKDDKRIRYIGYPSLDILYSNENFEINKLTQKKYNKIILWMPTFRKGGGINRNDSFKDLPLGIPLFNNFDEYSEINEYLEKNNSLLIIKLHPKQDLSDLKINNMSNIIVLTGNDMKKYALNNYELMNYSNALISDYSGAAYEYLHTNKPIAYVLDDMNEYKQGFVVEDIHELIAGSEIYNINDFKSFINDVIKGKDKYKKKREKVKKFIYNFNDGKSSERLCDLLGLEK